MNKIVLAFIAASLFSVPAFAADGIVKEFNKETRVIMLEDGPSYTIPADVAIPPEVKAAAKVSVQTDKNDNTKIIDVLMNP